MSPEEFLGGGFGVVVLLFALVLVILTFLMPFFIYGTNKRTKETSAKLDTTNKLLSDIRDSLNR